MEYCTIRDLRNTKKEVWDNLSEKGELVVMNNGHPKAVIFDVNNNSIDIVLKAIRQAKAMIAFNQMREKAQKAGYLTEEEINKEINEARKVSK